MTSQSSKKQNVQYFQPNRLTGMMCCHVEVDRDDPRYELLFERVNYHRVIS